MKRVASLTLGTLTVCAAMAATGVRAAVSTDQFPPRTTKDLIALCSATKDDPLMTAAVNFCNGFAEGVVEMGMGYEAVTRRDRQAFCLPTPRPTHNEALGQFTAWANAQPERLDEPPAVGVMRFLVHQYPCSHGATGRTSAK